MQHKQRAPSYLLSSYQHNSEGAPVMQIESIENTNADRRWQWPHLYPTGSGASATVYANAPCGDCPTCPPTPPSSRVRTRGGDFHDANAAQRAAPLIQDAVLQRFEHSLLWQLWQVLQVLNWYVKLGPVVGNHTLTVVSRWDRKGVRIFEKGRSTEQIRCF